MTAARKRWRTPWLAVLAYGVLIAGGALLLEWIDYRRMARLQSREVSLALVACAFLAFGVVVGLALRRPAPREAGNEAAAAALGISARELEVLHQIAAGHSTKQIAARLHVSPNTVKTHVARLFEKLDARRRTDALARARSLGLLP